MAAVLKTLPLLLCWGGAGFVLMRYFADRKKASTVGGSCGFVTGAVIVWLLLRILPGESSFGVIKAVAGSGIILLYAVGVAVLYRTAGAVFCGRVPSRIKGTSTAAAGVAFLSGVPVGMLMASKLPTDAPFLLMALCLAFTTVLAVAALGEPYLHSILTVTAETFVLFIVSVHLFIASGSPRLDLFSPLTMKVMKFIHDFVHQFFESMLIPDHPFFRPDVWNYIGLLFSKGVGFWGGLVIWFTPLILVMLAISLERLPSVAHIRQGAQRRKMLASFMRERNRRQLVPLLSFLILAGAVYQSRFPAVEYWNPKPLPVSANGAGQIVISRKGGELDLDDGKIHKYLYRQGGREIRFFVLMTPMGHLSVTLDACAICQPDGYGQGEGTVICYYCKTLIPLETVGKPGGCNPVPVPFTEQKDGVIIDAMTLLNTWNSTVQATTRVKGGSR